MATTSPSPNPEDRNSKRLKGDESEHAYSRHGGPRYGAPYGGGPPPMPPHGYHPAYPGGPPPPHYGGGAMPWAGGGYSSSRQPPPYHKSREEEEVHYSGGGGAYPGYSRGPPPPPHYASAAGPPPAMYPRFNGSRRDTYRPSNSDPYRSSSRSNMSVCHSIGTGGPDDDAASSAAGSSSKDKARGSYRCGRCGEYKKGHICPYQPLIKKSGDEQPVTRTAAVQVEMDEFMTIRRLNLYIQGFPESYTSEPYSCDNMVVGEPHPPPMDMLHISNSRASPPLNMLPPVRNSPPPVMPPNSNASPPMPTTSSPIIEVEEKKKSKSGRESVVDLTSDDEKKQDDTDVKPSDAHSDSMSPDLASSNMDATTTTTKSKKDTGSGP